MNTPTLYARLGGSPGIARIVDDIVTAHMENDTIKARFLPYASQPEQLAVVKGHLCMFLETGGGGPGEYTGRSMPEAHRGMNISAAEYMAAIDDIMQVLGAHDVDAGTQNEVLAICWSLKGEIMAL